MRHILLYQDEDGAWIVECPSLPGCYSQGDTRDEAIENIKEAIQLWIEDALDHGEEIPVDHPHAALNLLPWSAFSSSTNRRS